MVGEAGDHFQQTQPMEGGMGKADGKYAAEDSVLSKCE
jgi:hypothetical protein